MRKHEAEGFEDAFRALMPRAYGLALQICGDPHVAQDAAAEGLSRAYARWGQIASRSYRDAWVLRVTANVAIDLLRKREPAVAAPPAIDVGEVATLRVATASALRSLPRRQREVVAMRYLAGLSEAEVAEVLEIAEGTVKSHAHRGLEALRGRLSDSELGEVIIDGA